MLKNLESIIFDLKIHQAIIETKEVKIEYKSNIETFYITLKSFYNEVIEANSNSILNVLQTFNKEGLI